MTKNCSMLRRMLTQSTDASISSKDQKRARIQTMIPLSEDPTHLQPRRPNEGKSTPQNEKQ